jgi:hypothetical protein
MVASRPDGSVNLGSLLLERAGRHTLDELLLEGDVQDKPTSQP